MKFNNSIILSTDVILNSPAIWTSASNAGAEGLWMWCSNKQYVTTNIWLQTLNDKNSNCGALKWTGAAIDGLTKESCTAEYRFICEVSLV